MKRATCTGGSVAGPVYVFGCTIQNQSDSDCQIEIRYGTEKQSESVINIPQLIPGQQQYSGEQKFLSVEGIGCWKEIQSIKITRADGRIQELRAPFKGVHCPENYWLFVVDNDQIKSITRTEAGFI